MSSLAGKVALVTGASRGIGRAIAEGLGRNGTNVAITYSGNREKAEAVVGTIQNNGVQAIAIQSDTQVNKIEKTSQPFSVRCQHLWLYTCLKQSCGCQAN